MVSSRKNREKKNREKRNKEKETEENSFSRKEKIEILEKKQKEIKSQEKDKKGKKPSTDYVRPLICISLYVSLCFPVVLCGLEP